jgi:hypothetical protein
MKIQDIEVEEWQGVHFSLPIGGVTPLDAAAMWWHLENQASELFPGTVCRIDEGSYRKPPFVLTLIADLPGVGRFEQTSRYAIARLDEDDFLITVDAFTENVLWRKGLGRYRFLLDESQNTVLDVESLYQAKVPIAHLNEAAVGAAKAHQRRYLSGRLASAEELANMRAAIAL